MRAPRGGHWGPPGPPLPAMAHAVILNNVHGWWAIVGWLDDEARDQWVPAAVLTYQGVARGWFLVHRGRMPLEGMGLRARVEALRILIRRFPGEEAEHRRRLDLELAAVPQANDAAFPFGAFQDDASEDDSARSDTTEDTTAQGGTTSDDDSSDNDDSSDDDESSGQ